MTFQPPPPPPGGTPPPPPPGQWGPPPGGGYPAPQKFDPKSVNRLDWGIIGAGVLAFLFSFIDFYDGADVTVGGRTVSTGSFGDAGSASAWNDVVGGGFFSWFAMVFAVAGAAVVAMALFAPQVKLPLSNRLLGLALFAAAALFEIIGIFVTPGDSSSGFGQTVDVSLNHGFGFWVSLIVILAGLVLSLMRMQQTGEALPGALANLPTIGQHGPQGGGQLPPQGYGQTPPPGYGQAPPPPPGYGPPNQ